MFARIKKAGRYEYLQIVENHRENKKSVQRVIATVGRIDQLKAKGEIEGLLRSLSRFSDRPLLVLSERNDGIKTRVKKIGPSLAFQGLWQELGIDRMLHGLTTGKGLAFPVERIAFLSVLCGLSGDSLATLSGQDDPVHGDSISPDHISRVLAFLGGEPTGTKDRPTPIGCTMKDAMEEDLFHQRPGQTGNREIAFLYAAPSHIPRDADRTASSRIPGGVAGIVVNAKGYPICSEVWPDAALETGWLATFTERVKARFATGPLCFVSERKTLKAATVAHLRKEQTPYILGTRVNEAADAGKGYGEKWIIETNTGLDAGESALRYRELEDVCLTLGNARSLLEDGPVLSRKAEITKGLAFLCFLALVLRKELDRRLRMAGHSFEWARIRDDLDSLQEITIEDSGKEISIRTKSTEGCRKILEATGARAPEPVRDGP